MQLPEELSAAMAEETRGITPAELARASQELSAAYRGERRPILDRLHRAAYLTARLPATYAVMSRILGEAKLRVPDLRITSMLDLGAGPGTVMWAAAANLPELGQIVAVEDSAEWISLGRRLADHAKSPAVQAAEWVQTSLAGSFEAGSFDLVTISSHLARTWWPLARIHRNVRCKAMIGATLPSACNAPPSIAWRKAASWDTKMRSIRTQFSRASRCNYRWPGSCVIHESIQDTLGWSCARRMA